MSDDAINECVKKTIETCLTVQDMIDINSLHLDGIRTECAITSELTQIEIRALESKLVKLFSRQLVAKRKCPDGNNIRELKEYPKLRQWLSVVGLKVKAIEAICERVSSFEALLKSSEHELKGLIADSESREEEIRHLITAQRNLKLFNDKLLNGEVPLDIDLHWDSWDRTMSNAGPTQSSGSSPRINRTRTSRTSEEILKNSPLSPPQSAGPWSPGFGSYNIVNTNSTNSTNYRDRRPTPPPTPPLTNRKNGNSDRKFPTTPPPTIKHQTNLLLEPFPLTKSKSHEEHLAHRIEPLDPTLANQLLLKYMTTNNNNHHNSFENLPHHRRRLATEPGLGHTSPIMTSPSLTSPSRSPPVISPDQQQDNCFVDAPVAPRSPRAHGMAHFIHHRFNTTMKINSTCNLCEKPMFFGYKCKECKYRCHRDCVDKVPPSCGLPNELVDVFKQTIRNEGRHSPIITYSSQTSNITSPGSVKSENINMNRVKKSKKHYNQTMINIPSFAGHDSSSNTSSCNSSTPSSPAYITSTISSQQTPPHTVGRNQFQFPDNLQYNPSLVTRSYNDHNAINGVTIETIPIVDSDMIETQKSTDSDKTVSGNSGSGSTDSEKTLAGRVDSQDSQTSDMDMDINDRVWPRQNSLTLREWDIPYDELKIEEKIGIGRFGSVFKGNWHGSVAIKRLNMNNVLDDKKTFETFKQEVATFRKTRHENLVLFMGACMKPPHLAIVTSLCKGMTLYTHIHLRKDKFNLNRTIIIAQQICQGMGYLHARGIVHKDLKTRNIFYENGKVVITDFGLFSVTKLCTADRKGDWLTIPKGWLCYLAPEVIRSLQVYSHQDGDDLPFTTESDVYSFGTVWYELLMGEWPFKGQPPEVIIWQIGKGMKQSLVNLQASKEIKDLLILCSSYNPAERADFGKLYDILSKLPKKRLQRSPSHPIHILRSAESIF